MLIGSSKQPDTPCSFPHRVKPASFLLAEPDLLIFLVSRMDNVEKGPGGWGVAGKEGGVYVR